MEGGDERIFSTLIPRFSAWFLRILSVVGERRPCGRIISLGCRCKSRVSRALLIKSSSKSSCIISPVARETAW